MTRDLILGEELPDWVGAKEFYQKYDPKEVIGRWVFVRDKIRNMALVIIALFPWNLYQNCSKLSRGVSSVVRRCVHKHTGQEYAVKIIEITEEKMTEQQLDEVKSSTLKEIHVLNLVNGHPSISESELCR